MRELLFIRERLALLAEDLGIPWSGLSYGYSVRVSFDYEGPGKRTVVVDATPAPIRSRDGHLLRTYPLGVVVLRDMHCNLSGPTQIAPDFDINTPDGFAALKAFLADDARVRDAKSRPTPTDAISQLGELV